MNTLLKFTKGFAVLLIVLILGGLFVEFYSFIFSKVVSGPISSLQKLENTISIPGGAPDLPLPKTYSYSIGLEDPKSGEILIATSEEPEWGAAMVGNCATVRFFPYPPWRVERSGTYQNARLLHLKKSCDNSSGVPTPEPQEPEQQQ